MIRWQGSLKCRTFDPQLEGVRTWPVRGFRKYVIVYRATEEILGILRVFHGSQNINRKLQNPR